MNKIDLQKVDKEQVLRCVNLCFECIQTDEKIIEEAKDIIRRCEERIQIANNHIQKARDRLIKCQGVLQLKVIQEVISEEEAK